MGYDIADYKAIDPSYGTLSDVDSLISEIKKRDMKLIMDLVVNHTSDQHAWFLDSRASKSSPKRDWYIWKPAKYDSAGKRQPPNQLGADPRRSEFGVDVGRGDAGVLSVSFHARAARFELGESRSAGRCA